MNFASVINFMNQQSKVLKELEELIAHNDRQKDPGHSVKPEDIETLRTYVSTMKAAVETAAALAKHYKNPETAETKPEKQPPKKTEEEKDAKSSKKRSSTKKKDSLKEEPAKKEPPKDEIPEDALDEFDFLN